MLQLISKFLSLSIFKLLARSLELLDLLSLVSLRLLDLELELLNLRFTSYLHLLGHLSLTNHPVLLVLYRFLRCSGFVSEFLHFFLSLLLINFTVLDFLSHLIDELLQFTLFLLETLLLLL